MIFVIAPNVPSPWPDSLCAGRIHVSQCVIAKEPQLSECLVRVKLGNSPKATGLPENAGVPGSTFGQQVLNDYGVGDLSYDGPCPPPTLNPTNHHYVFTVYALDSVLSTLPIFGDFAPNGETLYQALIVAGRHGHILATASTDGFFPGN
ncbi:MAG: hypothetical protein DMG70_28530 [Acidobacteria bacterium]|nr:MAG: hypothetical protein DMG70_28530 [Acidobacteriota bacterium]